MTRIRTLWGRIHGWFASSAPVTRRQFSVIFLILFMLVTVSLASEGRLIRSNHRLIRANQAQTVRLEQQIKANRALTQRLAKLAREGQKATRSLCALEDDLLKRVSGARAFLRAHPNGIDGFTPSLIRNSIRQAQQTIRALGLDCRRPSGRRPTARRPR